jgi:predicted amidophosphoribosyltransferase
MFYVITGSRLWRRLFGHPCSACKHKIKPADNLPDFCPFCFAPTRSWWNYPPGPSRKAARDYTRARLMSIGINLPSN